jgi:hypothetical protein
MKRKTAKKNQLIPRSAAERLMSVLHSMDETKIHKDVIHPLLIALGFIDVVYTHGSQERGKDFIYIEVDKYQNHRLHVCQVKNKPFSGRSRDRESVSEVLNQLLQCVEYESLNPVTHQKELPWEATLYTTYPLPDAATADAHQLLDRIKQKKIVIIGPDKLAGLIQNHLPDLFAQITYPEQTQIARLRDYIDRHHESIAFDTKTARRLSRLFTPMDVKPVQSWIRRFRDYDLGIEIRTVANFHNCSTQRVQRLNALVSQLPAQFKTNPPFHLDDQSKKRFESPAKTGLQRQRTRRFDSLSEGRELNISYKGIIPFLESMRKLGCESSKMLNVEDARECAEAIVSYLKCGEVIGEILSDSHAVEFLSRASDTEEVSYSSSASHYIPSNCTLCGVSPELLLEIDQNLVLIGDAGAGKTTVARAIGRSAIDREQRVVYFPCHRVSERCPSLRESIEEFLQEVCGFTSRDKANEWIANAQLIILDGCDEADSYGRGLAEEIEELCCPALQIGLSNVTCLEIPNDLKELVRIETVRSPKEGSPVKVLCIEKGLGIIDTERLYKIVADNLSDDGTTIRQRIKQKRPRTIVTVRSGAPLELPIGFVEIELRDFTLEQLEVFFRKWCEGPGIPAQPLIDFVAQNPILQEVAATPLIASILAGLYENNMELPRTKVQIYSKRFELLHSKWDIAKGIRKRSNVASSDKEHFLARLAYRLHCKHQRRFSLVDVEPLWTRHFARVYPHVLIEDLLHELLVVNNVIERDGKDDFSLGHLSFQEFLAAKDIVFRQNVAKLARVADDPWWNRVVLFFVGLTGDPYALFRELRRRPGPANTKLIEQIVEETRVSPDSASAAMVDCASEDDDFHFDAEDSD